ncbi:MULTISPECIES: hypothetical protein [unclassified Bradyrhizobium]|nr:MULTISPECIES: hypothetical protein [unclassified Bradyrhizobium]
MVKIRTEADPRAEVSEDPECTSFAAAPPYADATLMVLERQFEAISAELLALEETGGARTRCLDDSLHAHEEPENKAYNGDNTYNEALTLQIEMILTRLDPIEQAIMQTQPSTIAGLGVKARHAAHVMSHYWECPVDQLDCDARVVRLLVEAVCNIAGTPLPIRSSNNE